MGGLSGTSGTYHQHEETNKQKKDRNKTETKTKPKKIKKRKKKTHSSRSGLLTLLNQTVLLYVRRSPSIKGAPDVS